MAIGVDTSKWKPRRISGTPAGKVGNIIGLSMLTFGLVWGAFYQLSGITANYRKKFEPFYEDPVSEIERKQLIAGGFPIRTGDKIRELMKEAERPDLPHK